MEKSVFIFVDNIFVEGPHKQGPFIVTIFMPIYHFLP